MLQAKSKKFYSIAFIIPAFLVYFVFFIFPNLLSFIFSFTDWNVYNINSFRFNGLENFKQMLREPIFAESIKHTFYYAIVSVIALNIVGFLLALIMDMKLKFKNFYRSVFFLPTTLSMLVVAPIFSALYNPQNGLVNILLREIGLGFLAREWLVDTRYAMNSIIVMSVWSSVGLTMLLYLSGLQTVPKEYYESANIDGCNYVQKLRHISIPLIIPSITVNMVLAVIGGLKVFGQVYALTNGGPAGSTEVFGTLIFSNFGAGLFGYSSAIGLCFTIIVCMISFILVAILRRREVDY